MASANLELVRGIRGAWDRGEFAAVDWAHPQLEFVIADGPTPGTWTGGWEDWRATASDYRELDGSRVLVLVELSGRSRASGLDIARSGKGQGANVFHLREGKVTRFVLYLERDRALTDLGFAAEADAATPG
jgi:hypothetical protein